MAQNAPTFPADASAMPAPILARGVIYLLGNGMQGAVVAAVRASDGARLWDSPGPDMGWLACDGTTVCAVSGLGTDAQVTGNGGSFPSQMWTYRASDGKLLYRSAFNAGYGPPAVTAGMAFALTARNGHIPSKPAPGGQYGVTREHQPRPRQPAAGSTPPAPPAI